MRPRGEIRAALFEAAEALHAEQGAATWRELAARAGVGFEAARMTVENMARCDPPDLVQVGSGKRAHSKRWMALYEPVQPADDAQGDEVTAEPAHELAEITRGWIAL